ncbi:MAG: hypothetical protein WCG85_06440 [Polyangia bacterium]
MNPKESRNPTSERTGMPPMMAAMMGASPDFNPAAMCQSMMTAVGKAAEMAAYATPEVRTLFEEWAHSVGDEVLVTLRTKGPMDLAALGKALKVSPDSVLFFLGRLVRDGRATITGIQATSDG